MKKHFILSLLILLMNFANAKMLSLGDKALAYVPDNLTKPKAIIIATNTGVMDKYITYKGPLISSSIDDNDYIFIVWTLNFDRESQKVHADKKTIKASLLELDKNFKSLEKQTKIQGLRSIPRIILGATNGVEYATRFAEAQKTKVAALMLYFSEDFTDIKLKKTPTYIGIFKPMAGVAAKEKGKKKKKGKKDKSKGPKVDKGIGKIASIGTKTIKKNPKIWAAASDLARKKYITCSSSSYYLDEFDSLWLSEVLKQSVVKGKIKALSSKNFAYASAIYKDGFSGQEIDKKGKKGKGSIWLPNKELGDAWLKANP